MTDFNSILTELTSLEERKKELLQDLKNQFFKDHLFIKKVMVGFESEYNDEGGSYVYPSYLSIWVPNNNKHRGEAIQLFLNRIKPYIVEKVEKYKSYGDPEYTFDFESFVADAISKVLDSEEDHDFIFLYFRSICENGFNSTDGYMADGEISEFWPELYNTFLNEDLQTFESGEFDHFNPFYPTAEVE